MRQSAIRSRIDENLRRAKITAEEVLIQQDPYSGWRILIVSEQFSSIKPAERRKIVTEGLENISIQWIDLLTPEEREWAGDSPLDVDVEDLPLWPEALARQPAKHELIFPSDLDEDLDRPIIATFYSLRGGVGRSTALAYTSRILANKGRSVICLDMDFEAPGLAYLMGKESELQESHGLVPLLLSLDQGDNPEVVDHIIRVSESNEIYLLPAGLPGADYARQLRLIDPEAWYHEHNNPLRNLIDMLGDLTFRPEVILIDARTGVTPLSAPLLFDLSDLAIVNFFPHPQAKLGTGLLVDALLKAQGRRRHNGLRLTPEPRFLVSPIPSSKAPEVVQRYRHRAVEWISNWLAPAMGRRSVGAAPLDAEEITHFISYRETIATSDRILSDHNTWKDYEQMAGWLELLLPRASEESQTIRFAELKPKVLEDLAFSTGTAEQQEHLLQGFVETSIIKKAMSPETWLVLGRKGTGKTAILRRIAEGGDFNSAVMLCPAGFRKDHPWVPGPDAMAKIESTLEGPELGWREFWTVYTAMACYLSDSDRGTLPNSNICESWKSLQAKVPITELQVVQALSKTFEIPDAALLAWDWLQKYDARIEKDSILLFDGLDTGFGNKERERRRRGTAIEGLFAFLMDRASALGKLHFKVLLREDIWRTLRFENKSHLFGRSVRLEWQNQSDYFKTVLKQAFRCDQFKRLLAPGSNDRALNIDVWNTGEVLSAWNLLVGERMKGGKTTFTRNWVWNRLADGNGDHGPRSLFQLFHQALEWEKVEHDKNTYDRSVIRPRALIASLDRVSDESLEALKEEFAELDELLEKLREIGRTPVDADGLEGLDEQLQLAREVGLLEVYEGTEEEVRRYKVPDMYRLALKMTRMGQA
jgi:cellulose biosynthesis protein BcsQ